MLISDSQFAGLLAACSDSRTLRGAAQHLLARELCARLDSYDRDHDLSFHGVRLHGVRLHPAFEDRARGPESLAGGPDRARFYMAWSPMWPHVRPPGTVVQVAPDLKTLVQETGALPGEADALIGAAVTEMTLDLFDESKLPFVRFLEYVNGGPHPFLVDLEARFSIFGSAEPGATWRPQRRVNWLGGFQVLGPLGDAIISQAGGDWVVELAIFARSVSTANPTTMSLRLTVDDVEVELYTLQRNSADPDVAVFFETFDTVTLDGALRLENASASGVEAYGLIRIIEVP